MAMDNILLGGFVDEEVAKINSNFAKCAEGTIPTKTSDLTNDSNFVTNGDMTTAINAAVSGLEIPTKTSDLTNDSNFVKTTDTAFVNKVDKETGKGLSTNDYTNDDKTKVGKLGKIDFTTSDFSQNSSDNLYYATLSAAGKYPVAVMRANGSDYEQSLAHTKVSGNNIIVVSAEAFSGYVVTM